MASLHRNHAPLPRGVSPACSKAVTPRGEGSARLCPRFYNTVSAHPDRLRTPGAERSLLETFALFMRRTRPNSPCAKSHFSPRACVEKFLTGKTGPTGLWKGSRNISRDRRESALAKRWGRTEPEREPSHATLVWNSSRSSLSHLPANHNGNVLKAVPHGSPDRGVFPYIYSFTARPSAVLREIFHQMTGSIPPHCKIAKLLSPTRSKM